MTIGNVSNFVLVFRSLAIERKTNIDYLAHHDQLTGLPNWTLFSNLVQRIRNRNAEPEAVSNVMMLSISNGTNRQNRLGHDAGDLLLKEFASTVYRLPT